MARRPRRPAHVVAARARLRVPHRGGARPGAGRGAAPERACPRGARGSRRRPVSPRRRCSCSPRPRAGLRACEVHNGPDGWTMRRTGSAPASALSLADAEAFRTSQRDPRADVNRRRRRMRRCGRQIATPHQRARGDGALDYPSVRNARFGPCLTDTEILVACTQQICSRRARAAECWEFRWVRLAQLMRDVDPSAR
mgnify:CR=1 FL=1